MKSVWIAALLALAACETTIVSVWKKSDTAPLAFGRVAIIANVNDEGIRRSVEDQFAKAMNVEAVQAYKLGVSVPVDKDALQASLMQAGCDGLITVTVTGVDKEAYWAPGPAGPYAVWGAWPMYDPGYYQVDTYVQVRTNIYKTADQELLFSTTSRTANPTDVNDLVNETIAAVSKELQRVNGPPPKRVSMRPTASLP
jgi:hypothetical protein